MSHFTEQTKNTEQLIRQWYNCSDERDNIRHIFVSEAYKYYKWWHHRDLITEEFVVGVDIPHVWYYIFSYGDQITAPFIHAHADRVWWGSACHRGLLKEDQIREFADYIDWFTLAYYGQRGLTREIIEEFGHLFDQYTWNAIYEFGYLDNEDDFYPAESMMAS